jgi:hypothetical protein
MHRPLPMVRPSQSMGVHPRLGRGDAASGLSASGGRFQAQRMEFGELAWNLELGTWNLEPGTWNLELGTWNLELGTWNLELRPNVHRPKARGF